MSYWHKHITVLRILIVFSFILAALVLVACQSQAVGGTHSTPSPAVIPYSDVEQTELPYSDSGQAENSQTAADPNVNLGGYTSQVSVAQGESIGLHVSNNYPTVYTLTVWREGVTRQLMQTIENVPTGQYPCNRAMIRVVPGRS